MDDIDDGWIDKGCVRFGWMSIICMDGGREHGQCRYAWVKAGWMHGPRMDVRSNILLVDVYVVDRCMANI